jgi:hypothetical protein
MKQNKNILEAIKKTKEINDDLADKVRKALQELRSQLGEFK